MGWLAMRQDTLLTFDVHTAFGGASV